MPWASVFNVSSAVAVTEAQPTAMVLIGLFIVGLPLSLVGTIQSAYRSAYVSSVWAITASIASLLALINCHRPGWRSPALVRRWAGPASQRPP